MSPKVLFWLCYTILMKQPVYIFDVDGVLNDLHAYSPDDRILVHIAKLMKRGAFVAINTGRGYDWIEENVVQPIRAKVNDTKVLERFFVSAEMGGVGVRYKDGVEQRVPSAFSLSAEQIDQVRQLYEQHPEYADRVHWYPKESMATLDKNPDTPLGEFKPAQKELTDMLRDLFKGQAVAVANSTDAVDIHATEAGKRAGAQLIYEWLKLTTDIQHDHFVCFGDSIVDYEMARFFAAQSHDATFVFTGPAFDGSLDPGVQFVKAELPYHNGTYQYLQTYAKI